jgi:hypothetical protein
VEGGRGRVTRRDRRGPGPRCRRASRVRDHRERVDVSRARDQQVTQLLVRRERHRNGHPTARLHSVHGVPVRARGTRARCVPVMSGTGGHSRSMAVTRNVGELGVRRCDLQRKES